MRSPPLNIAESICGRLRVDTIKRDRDLRGKVIRNKNRVSWERELKTCWRTTIGNKNQESRIVREYIEEMLKNNNRKQIDWDEQKRKKETSMHTSGHPKEEVWEEKKSLEVTEGEWCEKQWGLFVLFIAIEACWDLTQVTRCSISHT